MDVMADLRIDDTTTADAVLGHRVATNKLAPVVRAVRALDTEVAGANTLADELDQADQFLGAALDCLGRELTSFATWISGADAGLAGTDQALASEAG
jgi:hypothetical protein